MERDFRISSILMVGGGSPFRFQAQVTFRKDQRKRAWLSHAYFPLCVFKSSPLALVLRTRRALYFAWLTLSALRPKFAAPSKARYTAAAV
jgi:hypothetical protein